MILSLALLVLQMILQFALFFLYSCLTNYFAIAFGITLICAL